MDKRDKLLAKIAALKAEIAEIYTGLERRKEYDNNAYGRLTVVGRFTAVGVIKVRLNVYQNSFSNNEAWIFNRRDKAYQDWWKRETYGIAQISTEPESMEKTLHNLDSHDFRDDVRNGQ